jgi:hypothetical protein
MPAIGPVSLLLLQQAQIKLVNQRGPLNQIRITLASNVRSSHLAEVGIHKRHKLLEGRWFAVAPLAEK